MGSAFIQIMKRIAMANFVWASIYYAMGLYEKAPLIIQVLSIIWMFTAVIGWAVWESDS